MFLTFDEFMNMKLNDYVVIGGAQIYELFESYVDLVHYTLVHAILPRAEPYYPCVHKKFSLISIEKFEQNERNEYPFTILKLKRNAVD